MSAAASAGVMEVMIEMKAVDPHGTNSSQTGFYYFSLDDSDTDVVNGTVNSFAAQAGAWEDFSDDTLMQLIVDKAHEHGIRAVAWFPVFSDRQLYAADTYFRLSPELGENFVSPANPVVRAHMKAVIRQAMDKFGFDGLYIDYMRYLVEEQPSGIGTPADSQFQAIYGVPINGPAYDSNHSLRAGYLDFRAEVLSSFAEELFEHLGSTRNMSYAYGAFLMPHSLEYRPDQDLNLGYPANSWSGVDYNKYSLLGMQLSPMVYWGTSDPGWWPETGWSTSWNQWAEKIVEGGVRHAATNAVSQAVPTYSTTYPAAEHQQMIGYAHDQGVRQINFFQWGHWIDANAFDLIDNSMSGAYGDNTVLTVTITNPHQVHPDKVNWPQNQSLDLQATASGGSGSYSIARYRIDGGAWAGITPGSGISETVDLSSLEIGVHSITLQVMDTSGRWGQDIVGVSVITEQ